MLRKYPPYQFDRASIKGRTVFRVFLNKGLGEIMKISIIDMKNIEGFRIGNAENIDKGTGCTVVLCEDGAVGGVDVRGGGPATRETDLLKSENTVNSINAVVLSGGSAFGLESASGVMRELSSRGIGFDTGYGKVPIVCGASLFDLSVGDGSVFPDLEMGKEAVKNAYEGKFEHGNRGAGTGASVGKFMGMERAMKTGLGTFACGDRYVQVGAIVAVNAMGDIYNGAGNIVAGLRTEEGDQIYGSIKSLKSMVHDYNDTEESAEELADSGLSKDTKSYNKAEIADAIRSAFSTKIKDSVKTDNHSVVHRDISEDNRNEPDNIESITDFYTSDMIVTGEYSKEEIQEAQINNNTENVTDLDYKAIKESPTLNVDEVEVVSQSDTETVIDDDDMGYDISFNTTIACLITNAKMTKSQANKLASILHDAYARAIKPVHGTMDGDTIFVLTTDKAEVNFDAFAALSTDVLQYAIIDAASSAKSAYGLPAACDIIKK